jgi:hypothetical protein
MTLDEYQSALTRLGLSQVGAARLFGYNERTSRRWATGEQPIPRVVEIVLWLILKFKVKPEDIPNEPEPIDAAAVFREPAGRSVMRERTPYRRSK